jgi:hypothetical protein
LMFNVWGAHRDADRCILVTAAQERLWVNKWAISKFDMESWCEEAKWYWKEIIRIKSQNTVLQLWIIWMQLWTTYELFVCWELFHHEIYVEIFTNTFLADTYFTWVTYRHTHCSKVYRPMAYYIAYLLKLRTNG